MNSPNLIIQFGLLRSFYPKQNILSTLRQYINADFQQLPHNFDLMYIHEQNGDWMILEEQKDLDRILFLNRNNSHTLLKVFPQNQEQPFICEPPKTAKPRKLGLTKEHFAMLDSLAEKYKKKVQEKERQSRLQNCIKKVGEFFPKCQKKQQISIQIEQSLQKTTEKHTKVSHLSPLKIIAQKRVDQAMIEQAKLAIPKIVELSLRKITTNMLLEKQACPKLTHSAKSKKRGSCKNLQNPEDY